MLHEFLANNTQEIIARTRAKVAARTIPVPTEDELKNGVPLFLSQFIAQLRLITQDNGAIEESATKHGGELLAMGFTVGQVVHAYGDICGGLPPGMAKDLFRPFKQRSAKRSGLGLGLSISHMGTEAMGGKISVRDLPGKGCVFAIELPRLPSMGDEERIA